MDKNEAIKIAADIIQSVYVKQTRECHETLAECIVDAFIEHTILNVDVPDYRDYLVRTRQFIVKEHHRCLNKDYLLDTCNPGQVLQN